MAKILEPLAYRLLQGVVAVLVVLVLATAAVGGWILVKVWDDGQAQITAP